MQYKFWSSRESGGAAAWVSQHIPGCERGFGYCTALTVGDPIIGAVVFHNYSPECGVLEMSAAATSPRWLTRPVLWAMHSYIFNDSGCQLAVMRVSENNSRMLRIAQAYGYESHRIPRLRGRNEAEVVLTLTDDQWRGSKFHR